MGPYQLEYFLALYQYRQFSKASEEINVSQSTLSYGIKKLEQELGVSLFIRTTRSVKPTLAGEAFLTYAKRILSDISQAKNAMAAHLTVKKASIRIGAVPVASYLGIMPIIVSFQRAYPGIHVEIGEDTTSSLLEKLASSEIDIAFVNYDSVLEEDFECYKLLHDRLVLLVSRGHPLASRKTVNLADLSQEKFLVETGQKKDFIASCHNLGFDPIIVMVSIHPLTLRELAEEGVGIVTLSYQVASSLLTSKTDLVNFTPVVDRITAMVHARNDITHASQVFRDFILKETPGISGSSM